MKRHFLLACLLGSSVACEHGRTDTDGIGAHAEPGEPAHLKALLSPPDAIGFQNPSQFILLRGGQIVVADIGDQVLHYFAPSGQYLGKAGQIGSGPGEYQSISQLFLAGHDTVGVWDGAQRLVHLFSADRRSAGSMRFEFGEGAISPVIVGRFANGRYVAVLQSVSERRGSANEIIEDSVYLLALEPSGDRMVLASLRGPRRLTARYQGGSQSVEIPSGFSGGLTVCQKGVILTTKTGVRILSDNGADIAEYSWAGPSHVYGDDGRIAEIERVAMSISDPRRRQQAVAQIDGAVEKPFVQFHPPLFDSNGAIWYNARKDSVRFVFKVDAMGRLLGSVQVRRGIALMYVSDSTMVGLVPPTDSTDALVAVIGLPSTGVATFEEVEQLGRCDGTFRY